VIHSIPPGRCRQGRSQILKGYEFGFGRSLRPGAWGFRARGQGRGGRERSPGPNNRQAHCAGRTASDTRPRAGHCRGSGSARKAGSGAARTEPCGGW
jgi:hypothetical protein